MPDAPSPHRTRLAAAAGLLGASVVAALLLGVGPAPSALQLAGANRDGVADDLSGNCDEAEHAGDPECAGVVSTDRSTGSTDSTGSTSSTSSTSTTVGDTTNPTAGGVTPTADEVRSLDAAGAGTVIYAVEGGSLRLVTATPASGWRVEVEQGAGREVELDFRSGSKRVQVNLELEDGQVRERVRFRDDADDTDIRTENGTVDDTSNSSSGSDDDNSNSGSGSGSGSDDDNSGSGSGSDDDDDNSGSGSGSDDDDNSNSGSGSDHPEDD